MQIAIFLIILVVVGWNIYLTYRVKETHEQFEALARVKKGSLSEILSEVVKAHIASKREFNELYREIERLDREKTTYFQKFGIVRFNPFGKNEYEQSFALALLDATGTGVVITSIHTNARARIYLKEISRGKSKIELSPEEKNAIQLAIKL